MSISTILDQIKKTLPRAERAYAEGRARHPALAAYECPSAVLVAISRGSALGPDARDTLLFALLEEMRRSPSTLWQSLVLLAYAPLLVKFRARLGRPRCDDLDQRVLSAFLEAARAVTSGEYVPRQLVLGLRWRLHAERNRDRRSRELTLFDDDSYAPDLFGVAADRKVAVAEVLAQIEAEGGADLREALLERHSSHGSFKEYVDGAYPHLPARKRVNVCDRLYAKETKVLCKLRARVLRAERRLARVA